jgi:hypothetical protein
LFTDNFIALFRSSNFVIQNNISTDSKGLTNFIGVGEWCVGLEDIENAHPSKTSRVSDSYT